MTRTFAAAVLALVGAAAAIVFGSAAAEWNDRLAVASPLAQVAPIVDDPRTPRLARRVVLVVIDGLRADEAHEPFLDELRARGASAIVSVPYPSVSRPNYVTILTGVPPRDSGIRVNSVARRTKVDSILDRISAAGLRSATASDYGSFGGLLVRRFDVTEHADSLAELAPITQRLVAGDTALVAILVQDVDRAGHAGGVGEAYRAAAADVDRMLRALVGAMDLTRDTVIVTADHGHVARGGHGGREREVLDVPLVLAGAGIAPGARPRESALVDIAPTIAALLGIPAPGHAEGRTLLELLPLDAAQAARRGAIDTIRVQRVASARHSSELALRWLALALGGLAAAALAARQLGRRGALALRGAWAGVVAELAIVLATVAITAGRLSPSYVPGRGRTQELGVLAIALAIAAQLVASWIATTRARDRVATANGIALVGLTLSLAVVALVRVWFSPPFFDVPGPAWMVLVPALEVAAATTGLATVLQLVIAVLRARRDNMPPDS